jgi:hypothetical protein
MVTSDSVRRSEIYTRQRPKMSVDDIPLWWEIPANTVISMVAGTGVSFYNAGTIKSKYPWYTVEDHVHICNITLWRRMDIRAGQTKRPVFIHLPDGPLMYDGHTISGFVVEETFLRVINLAL